MKNLADYIDSRFCPDSKLCQSKEYVVATQSFNQVISMLESKHPEDKELITQLIIARAVLETTVSRYMFRKGLNSKWKVRSKQKEKGN